MNDITLPSAATGSITSTSKCSFNIFSKPIVMYPVQANNIVSAPSSINRFAASKDLSIASVSSKSAVLFIPSGFL